MMSMLDIKLMVLDVDGVLTNGELIIGNNGVEYKKFNVKDGMGISIGKYAGMKFAIITGRKSESVKIRAEELKIDYVFQGIQDKKKILRELISELNLDSKNICYIGDDINDLPIMNMVGFSCAPRDAVHLVKKVASYTAQAKGGDGVVREVIEYILEKNINYNNLIEEYINMKANMYQ